ncbi:MAG: endo-1,4-beta-xylanase, partial [Pirellulales bacterium]
MGVMRFLVHPPGRLTDETLQRIYMSGLDRVPWNTHVTAASDGILVERAVSDSGNLYVPWSSASFGEITLTTGSLMERDKPYHLEVELARGKVNQVRSQMAEWQAIGLTPPQTLLDQLHQAVELFSLAATSQNEPAVAAGHAQRAIEAAIQAAMTLGSTFTEQALAARYRQTARLSTNLGAHLGNAPLDDATGKLVRASFNTAAISLGWRDVEATQGHVDWSVADAQVAWCQTHGLRMYGGPLVRLDSQGLPDWLYLWEGDFDNVLDFLSEHTERTIQRYKGKVEVWVCSMRVNVGSMLSLREVDKQRL